MENNSPNEAEKKKPFGIQNFVSKTFIMILAGLWLTSHLWPHILKGFFLTDREVENWGSMSDILVIVVSISMVLGGIYLNAILDLFKSVLSNFIGKKIK